MAISATATSNLTVDQTIETAMRSVGVLNTGQPAKPADLAHGRIILFLHLQALQSRGVLMRARERISLTLTAGTSYVDAPADTISIEDGGVLRNADGDVDRPLMLYQLPQYQALPNKTLQGEPNSYFPEKQSATDTWRIFLYPVPLDSTWPTLVVPRSRKLRDVEDGSVTLDVEPRWLLPIMRAIGEEFARNKGRSDTASEMASKFTTERDEAMDDETTRGPGQFIVGPDPWSNY